MDPYPLVFNKLPYLLKGAKILIANHFDQIAEGDCSFVRITQGEYVPHPYSEHITSLLNYAQTAMLAILANIRGTA